MSKGVNVGLDSTVFCCRCEKVASANGSSGKQF